MFLKAMDLHMPKHFSRYLISVFIPVSVLMLMSLLRSVVTVTDVMLIGVACVTLIGFRYGQGEAIVASLVSVLIVDIFFVEPYYTLAVHNFDYLLSFFVMLAVGIFIAQLAERNRMEFKRAHQLLLQIKLLYRVARGLGRNSQWQKQVDVVSNTLKKGIGRELRIGLTKDLSEASEDKKASLITYGKVFIETPMLSSRQSVRTLGLCARMLNQAYERYSAQEEKQAVERFKEREVIRANLLRSIGHDLRTPLGTIMGASSLLLDEELSLSPTQYQEQAANIYQQSLILKNQIDKMLELSRIRDLATTNDWLTVPSEDLISAAFARTKVQAREQFEVVRHIDFIKGDSALLEVALANLIDNALHHGRAPFFIDVNGHNGDFVVTVINDKGVDKPNRTDSGTGLGLLICDAVAKLHDGLFSYQQKNQQFIATLSWSEQ